MCVKWMRISECGKLMRMNDLKSKSYWNLSKNSVKQTWKKGEILQICRRERKERAWERGWKKWDPLRIFRSGIFIWGVIVSYFTCFRHSSNVFVWTDENGVHHIGSVSHKTTGKYFRRKFISKYCKYNNNSGEIQSSLNGTNAESFTTLSRR